MTAPQLKRLHAQMVRLRLQSRERIDALLQEERSAEHSHADFLDRTAHRGGDVQAKNVETRTSLAGFPFVMNLDKFDFGYQLSIDRKQLQSG